MTRYTNMLLALDRIPRLDNLLASFFTWLLLAGFVLFPGTFASLQTVSVGGTVTVEALHAIQHVSLFVIAWICTGIAAMGMIWLWWKWMNNYVWIVNKIFMPGFMNSLAGLLSTIANVFGAQHGQFTSASITTLAVTGGAAVITGLLVAAYSLGGIRRVRAQHEKQIGEEGLGKHGEGVVESEKAPRGDLQKLHGHGGSMKGGEAIAAETGHKQPVVGVV